MTYSVLTELASQREEQMAARARRARPEGYRRRPRVVPRAEPHAPPRRMASGGAGQRRRNCT